MYAARIVSISVAAAMAPLAGQAVAQTNETFLLESSNAVSPPTSNTTAFNVVLYATGSDLVNLFPHEFTPGSGVINDVPAQAV